MYGTEWEQLGRVAGAVLVELALCGVSVAFALYLRRQRRVGGEYGDRAPGYTAAGVFVTLVAHFAVMVLLWPLEPLAVSGLLLASFVVSGLPPAIVRDLDTTARTAEDMREKELEAAERKGRLAGIREMASREDAGND